MKKPNKAEITSKCVEVSKCLLDTTTGLHTQDLATTRTNGDIARFVANIKGSDFVDLEKLGAISSALKIDYRFMESSILPQAEDLGWIEIKRKGRKIKRVDEHVPPIQDTLSTLGKEWKENSTITDETTVYGLTETSKNPITHEALISELDLSENDFKTAKDYGMEANYFGSFISEEKGQETLWSPLYWAGKIDLVLKFLQRQTEQNLEGIGKITKDLRNYPGTPLEKCSNPSLIDNGITSGYFPSVSIRNRNNEINSYIFAATPQFQVEPKHDIFEKARLIVSSLRAGQYHAEVTKIKWPTLVLKRLRDGTLSPHSYAEIQYAPLITHGICKVTPVKKWYGVGFKPEFIKTPENNLAADVADQMLRGEEPVDGKLKDPKIDEILRKGVYNYSSEVRRIKSAKRIEASSEFEILLQRMRGSGVVE